MDGVKNHKILVVEDDKYLRNAFRVMLTKAGFEIQLAADGDDAIAILATFHPDLILLDLIMPKRDGFSVLKEIKNNPLWKNIPVLIASNLGQKEDIDEGIKLGAIDYIVKGNLSTEEILLKIQKLLSKE
jgi:DNA-binding response OmpR family regulator